jgi:hypothetical protein
MKNINKLSSLLLTSALILTLSSCYMFKKYEEPNYKVSEKSDNIEIREYSSTISAEATVAGDKQSAANQGFRIIAAYIFGDNISKEKVAMTTPVVQEKLPEKGEKIAMTTPVTQEKLADDKWKIKFFMPSEYKLADLPKTKDERIKFTENKPYKAAVIRFSGSTSQENFEKHREILRAYLNKNKIKHDDNFRFAYYNPPFTPWFLKRNEVIVNVKSK